MELSVKDRKVGLEKFSLMKRIFFIRNAVDLMNLFVVIQLRIFRRSCH